MNEAGATRLREAERVAAATLDRGCVEDLNEIGRFLAGPIREAEAEIRDEVASLGGADPILRHNVLVQQLGDIAERCWEKVFANIALRFRARFSIYAQALLDAEERFLSEVDPGRRVRRRRKPRRVVVPRVMAPDAPALTLERGGDESVILGCVEQLERRLRDAIAEEVERARVRLVRRGSIHLARTRIASRLDASASDGGPPR